MTRGETRAAVSETTARGLGVERFTANAKASGSTRSRRTRIPDGLPTASACRSGFVPAVGADEQNAARGGRDAREGDPSTRRNLARARGGGVEGVAAERASERAQARGDARRLRRLRFSRRRRRVCVAVRVRRDQKRLAVCASASTETTRAYPASRAARAVAGTTSITSLSSPSTTGRATCADAFRHRAERVRSGARVCLRWCFRRRRRPPPPQTRRAARPSTTPRLCSSARSRLRASCGKLVFSGPGSDAASLCPGSKRVSREESANETRRSSTRGKRRGDAAASRRRMVPTRRDPPFAREPSATPPRFRLRRVASASSSSSSSSVFVFAFSPTLSERYPLRLKDTPPAVRRIAANADLRLARPAFFGASRLRSRDGLSFRSGVRSSPRRGGRARMRRRCPAARRGDRGDRPRREGVCRVGSPTIAASPPACVSAPARAATNAWSACCAPAREAAKNASASRRVRTTAPFLGAFSGQPAFQGRLRDESLWNATSICAARSERQPEAPPRRAAAPRRAWGASPQRRQRARQRRRRVRRGAGRQEAHDASLDVGLERSSASARREANARPHSEEARPETPLRFRQRATR